MNQEVLKIIESIVMILAGCGALMIGFKLLSDNMEKIAGSSLKKLFNKTSDNKLIGVGMGAVTTAVVQSSGVTTVMVVGFVNAGIMSLKQATAIIMGANIGTTITAQIASLKSLPIEPIFISLVFIGVMMEMFCKKDKLKSVGNALAGLGMVFFALNVMSTQMSAYATTPAVQNFLQDLNNPFLLLLFGIALTALVQSSSAVTSIVIVMASAGLIIGGGGNAVLYLILGSNIGSCVTALMSSIGTSVNARRASIIHLLFNTIGTVIFMIIFLIWKDFFNVTFVKWFAKPETQIAMFHTAFNVICTLLFLPFSGLLVKVATLLVPEKKVVEEKAPSDFVFMDKRFLSTPSIAIGQLKKETFRMADMAVEGLRMAFGAFIDRDTEVLEKVYKNNENIAQLSENISHYLVRVSATSGVALSEEKKINELHNDIGDIARVAELSDNLTKYTRRAVRENLTFSEGINEKLTEMHEMLQKQYAYVKQIVLDKQYDLIQTADDLEEDIDNMRRALVAEHIVRLSQGKCKPENNTVFINLVSNLERIGDHLNYIIHNGENA